MDNTLLIHYVITIVIAIIIIIIIIRQTGLPPVMKNGDRDGQSQI